MGETLTFLLGKNMKKTFMRQIPRGVAIAVAAMAGLSMPQSVLAEDAADEIEEVMVIGTRRAARSAADTPAPVDIISGAEFTRNAAADV